MKIMLKAKDHTVSVTLKRKTEKSILASGELITVPKQ